MTDVKSMAATRANIARGTWDGTPAIPATDVPVVNNSGLDMMVRLNGGTVTVVKLDGVTVAGVTTGEWIPLRNGSSLTLTYSVVPTAMQWFPWH
jgi:hypothetical protein